MISAKDLSRCIDNLAEINASIGHGNSAIKRLILEVGYILKQEMDNVNAWESQVKSDRNRGYGNIDVNKIMEDNTQLFNENRKLHEANLKLKEVIDQRMPNVQQQMEAINNKLKMFSESLSRA